MHNPRNAAKERAATFRAAEAKAKEQRDRTKSDLAAGQKKGDYTAEAVRVLEDFILLEDLRMHQYAGLALEYEKIAAGGRAFAVMPAAELPRAKEQA